MPLNRLASGTRIRWGGVCLSLISIAPIAWAQNAGGIYTCVDARGRTITSDRPIAACLDREQRELNKLGIVKRVIPPSYTAEEQAAINNKRKQEEAERARVAEEQRRDRALVMRYPTQALHDKERNDALAQIEGVIAAVNKRGKTLEAQRSELNAELEFYQNDINKAPTPLKRRFEDNAEQMKSQQRLLMEQTQEKQRVSARFDEELAKLRQLWAQ